MIGVTAGGPAIANRAQTLRSDQASTGQIRVCVTNISETDVALVLADRDRVEEDAQEEGNSKELEKAKLSTEITAKGFGGSSMDGPPFTIPILVN